MMDPEPVYSRARNRPNKHGNSRNENRGEEKFEKMMIAHVEPVGGPGNSILLQALQFSTRPIIMR